MSDHSSDSGTLVSMKDNLWLLGKSDRERESLACSFRSLSVRLKGSAKICWKEKTTGGVFSKKFKRLSEEITYIDEKW